MLLLLVMVGMKMPCYGRLRSRWGHYIFALWFLSFYLFLFLA